MAFHFCLSVTLLDAAYHGRRDDGVPEWPPSPLRAFQSLVAAAAARRRSRQLSTDPAPAFEWLEGLEPPEIVAPPGQLASLPYRLYVPNNAGDLMTKAWAAGNTDASMAAYRTEKDVHPTRLVGGDAFTGGNTIRFLWQLPSSPPDGTDGFVSCLSAAARSLTHLGWGIDLAAGHAELLDERQMSEVMSDRRLERWRPGMHGTPLRVPQPETPQGPSTFRSLVHRYELFTRRMSGGRPQDVPPLTDFRVVGYSRATDPPTRPFAAFSILKSDASGFYPFNTLRQTTVVAGMVRHVVSKAVERAGWSGKEFAAFVHGHRLDGQAIRGEKEERRLAYLPLPSLERRGENGDHVGMVRRVLIVGPPDAASEIAFVRRTLSGQPMIEEGKTEPVAILSGIRDPDGDWNIQRYTQPFAIWSTVTPVLLPGFDDGKEKKAGKLLIEAFTQAGLSPELVCNAEIEFRKVGFRPGVEIASRYEPPQKLKHWPRYHVRVRWLDANGGEVRIPGPLAVGAGRHRGFGVFANHSA